MKHLGQILRTWRVMSSLSIRSAASEIGLSASTLSRVERGELPDAKTLVKIILWLLGEEE